ncbi:MAG: MacB family efflux pump subunit [Holosporales bacterium]|jgi:macrolide transport system ATP-binding/permease protein|nr:MacB family efflux pump subunit [Holosporales bacterium]
MKIIEIKNINKYFGNNSNKIHILKDINISIEKGDFVAIVGQSGSGKSTLMNIIGCLDTPTSGFYKINGIEVGKMNKDEQAELRCKTFGFIFQRYNLLSMLTAKENVALPASYFGIASKARTERAKTLLNNLNLDGKLENLPSELSGGQQQRVSIARALMNGGEIILADEPTGALDSKSGEMVMKIIKDLHAKGHTIIIVTHDKTIAAQASRIIEIKDGVAISDTRNNDKIYGNLDQIPPAQKSKFSQLKYQLSESFRMSVQAIIAHKMRSLLTMLGIIIGITSVVTIVAVGNGYKEKMMGMLSSFGANTVTIIPGSGFGDKNASKIKTLKASDAKTLGELKYVDSVSPNIDAWRILVYKSTSLTARLEGVSAEFLSVNNKKLESGRKFTAVEVENAAPVAIINQYTKKELFGTSVNPLGENLIFGKQPLKVIGVIAEEDGFGPPDTSLNIYVPYTTAMYKILGKQEISTITIRIKDGVNSHLAENNLVRVLTSLHEKKDFFTVNSNSVRKAVSSVADIMTLLVSTVAFIALIVGGIGVMNIMLVSITERTKEIGIRMAIGAKQKDILQQFLIESILICLLGGFIGVSLSVLMSLGLNSIMQGFRMVISVNSVIIALLFSSTIGIIFGYVPAKKAANLNPIDALARD